MNNITFDYSNSFIKEHEMDYIEPFITTSHNLLHGHKVQVKNLLVGWICLETIIKRRLKK